jgi:hypothetical protein
MNIGLTPRTLRKKTPVAIRSDIDTRNPCIIAMNSHATGNAAHQQNVKIKMNCQRMNNVCRPYSR